jgi:hypothetical protein
MLVNIYWTTWHKIPEDSMSKKKTHVIQAHSKESYFIFLFIYVLLNNAFNSSDMQCYTMNINMQMDVWEDMEGSYHGFHCSTILAFS